MPFRFIHSADLHLGRRFGNLPEDVRGRLIEARHQIIATLAQAARDHAAAAQRHRLGWMVAELGVPFAAPGG
jgi:hypothetical protein